MRKTEMNLEPVLCHPNSIHLVWISFYQKRIYDHEDSNNFYILNFDIWHLIYAKIVKIQQIFILVYKKLVTIFTLYNNAPKLMNNFWNMNLKFCLNFKTVTNKTNHKLSHVSI